MRERQPFTFLGNIKSFHFLHSVVSSFDDAKWFSYGGRRVGIAAENTDTIPLIHDTKNKLNSFVKHQDYDTFEPFIEEVALLLDSPAQIQQAMLTRLRAGSVIGRHKDKGEVTARTHRIHLPIMTNPQCIFTVDAESRHMEAGDVWIIDNVDKYHSVVNNGSTHRVHLIIDALPLYNE